MKRIEKNIFAAALGFLTATLWGKWVRVREERERRKREDATP